MKNFDEKHTANASHRTKKYGKVDKDDWIGGNVHYAIAT